jgi:hypothetical protein
VVRCRSTAHPVQCPGALLAVDGSGMVLGFTGITALNAGRFKAFWSLESILGWRSAVSDYSDLVEIAKRNGEFRKNYGPFIGAFLYLRSINAARPRSFWWRGLYSVGTVLGGIWLKYGWPIHG